MLYFLSVENSLVEDGLICTISTVELCNAFSVLPNKQTHKLEMKCMKRKCLHYYFYYLDKVYGFMFIKLQTWFPFTLTVYINGRELMKKAFEEEGISYSMYDNSFSFINLIPRNFPDIWIISPVPSTRFFQRSKKSLETDITGVQARWNTPPILCLKAVRLSGTYTPPWWDILFLV